MIRWQMQARTSSSAAAIPRRACFLSVKRPVRRKISKANHLWVLPGNCWIRSCSLGSSTLKMMCTSPTRSSACRREMTERTSASRTIRRSSSTVRSCSRSSASSTLSSSYSPGMWHARLYCRRPASPPCAANGPNSTGAGSCRSSIRPIYCAINHVSPAHPSR